MNPRGRKWGIETTPEFDRAARKLDRQVLRRIRAYLDEVCGLDDPRDRGRGLTGNLSGYWRYRVGDYRVLAKLREEEIVVVAIALGHRSSIH